jgi:putative Ca2+/H+ antiporter (TMEM165/GDT1 family)
MLALALAVFGAVLTAELMGDKLLYTVAAIAGRYSLSSVGVGFALACGGKMFCAVALGRIISALPTAIVSLVTAATFVIAGVAIWRRYPDAAAARKQRGTQSGVLVMFGSVFFAEWGDLGQITVASIAARTGAPMVVWVAATAALLTKGALAVTIGFGLRRFLPLRVMHYASVMTCLTMAAIAIREAGR